jgi:hypothetical protein
MDLREDLGDGISFFIYLFILGIKNKLWNKRREGIRIPICT